MNYPHISYIGVIVPNISNVGDAIDKVLSQKINLSLT